MESLISLRYPNGRVHEAILTTPTALTPGDRFDLYGRHWNAVQMLPLPRGGRLERQRMLCLSSAERLTPER
jgi:hypothetical protein